MISAKNMSHSSHLEARDQLYRAFGDVRLKGRMGSHQQFRAFARGFAPSDVIRDRLSLASKSSDEQKRGSRRGRCCSAAQTRASAGAVWTGISVGSGGWRASDRRPPSATDIGLPGLVRLGCEAIVAMVQAADLGQFDDLAHGGRVDRSRLGRVFAQRQMRSRPMVVAEIGFQDPV